MKTIHLVMAYLDHLGISNPFASLHIREDSFDIQNKLFSNSSLIIPISGRYAFQIYAASLLWGLIANYVLYRILAQIFHCFSQEKMFMKKLVTNTKFLAGWFFIISIAQFRHSSLCSDESIYIHNIIFSTLISIFIWFLAKVFEAGNKIQKEIELTI
ncbi:MAG: hypothetical protein P1U56_21325 [Saprospiraceae bacterium]|nr:hypothetical protein [Saprospiraceae bacterium]